MSVFRVSGNISIAIFVLRQSYYLSATLEIKNTVHSKYYVETEHFLSRDLGHDGHGARRKFWFQVSHCAFSTRPRRG